MKDIYFIVGPSFSGKSSLARLLAKKQGRKIVILNNRSPPFKGARNVGFKDIGSAGACTLIVEDLIRISDAKRDILQNLVNYSSHHADIAPIFLLTHSIKNNNIFCLLPFVRGVLFMTKSNSTIKSVRDVLSYFGYDKREVVSLVDRWRSFDKPYSFFHYNVEEHSFRHSNVNSLVRQFTWQDENKNLNEDRKFEIRERGERILDMLGKRAKLAIALLHFIIDEFDMDSFSDESFSISIVSRRHRKRLVIDLIHFIHTLLSSKTKTLSNKFKIFFTILKTRHCLPDFFILNPSVKRWAVKHLKRKRAPMNNEEGRKRSRRKRNKIIIR